MGSADCEYVNFEVLVQDTKITMTLDQPSLNKGKLSLTEMFGFHIGEPVVIPLHATLGNRLQTEMLFRHRLRLSQ